MFPGSHDGLDVTLWAAGLSVQQFILIAQDRKNNLKCDYEASFYFVACKDYTAACVLFKCEFLISCLKERKIKDLMKWADFLLFNQSMLTFFLYMVGM